MCIFRSEFSAVDNNETFGRNISFNDTFISSFQKIKSQKDLNSLIVHGACVSKVEEETGKYYGLLKKTLKPLDSLYSSAPQWMEEGSFFLVLADQLLSGRVYSANKAMDSSNMCLNGTIRYTKSFENRYRLVNKH